MIAYRLVIATLVLVGILFTPSREGLAQVFFSEGFESGNGSTFSGSAYGSINGNPQYTIQDSIVANGRYSLQHHFDQGQGGSFATHQFGDSPDVGGSPTEHFLDIYIQFKLRYSNAYDFSAGNNKIMIIGTQDSRRHDTICCNPWVSHYITLYANETGSNAVFDVEGNNKRQSSGQWFALTPNLLGPTRPNGFQIERNRWWTIEVHLAMNTLSNSNGIFEMWIDGTQVTRKTDVLYRIPWDGSVGTDPGVGINFVMLSHYINSGAPGSQDMYYDDIIFSTAYIGTSAPDTTPPASPTGLTVR
jgi:hypothetical protein